MTSGYWVTPQLGFGPHTAAKSSGAQVVVHLHDVPVRRRFRQRTHRRFMVDGPLPTQDFLDEVVTLVVSHLQAGRKVLLCCEEGRNRSSFIAGLALEVTEGLRGQEVVDRLVAARLSILSNRHFLQRLREGPSE